jgi:ribosomal-protein-alanine N-acetyltransferase
MNGLVRRAGLEDIAGVVRLERKTETAPHWAEGEYAAIVQQDGEGGLVRRCFFVTEMEGRLVGFAVGKAVGSEDAGLAELESVVVDTAARRMGVGRALCTAVITWCRELPIEELELEVREGSDGAIALYRRLGFAEVGRRKKYYREPVEDALLMRLKLGSEK